MTRPSTPRRRYQVADPVSTTIIFDRPDLERLRALAAQDGLPLAEYVRRRLADVLSAHAESVREVTTAR